MTEYKVAVIRGDGIGVEVIEEGIKVLEALSGEHNISWQIDEHPWSSDYYIKNGHMMPSDGLDTLTPGLGGSSITVQVGDAVVSALS